MPPDGSIDQALVKAISYCIKSPLPRQLEKELGQYFSWAGCSFQLDRVGSYARGVDTGTLEREKTQILGYLGFCSQQFNLPLSSLDLSLFERPDYVLSLFTFLKVRKGSTSLKPSAKTLLLSDPPFLSLLQLRGVGFPQFINFIKVIRKILAYLKTLQPLSSSHLSHLERMIPFLSTATAQLEVLFPKRQRELTQWQLIKQWTDLLEAKASSYLRPNVRVTRENAFFIQSTCLALILVGRFTPPLRACIIRGLHHPSKVSVFWLQDFAELN